MNLEKTNYKLRKEYGIFQASNLPNWQLVWSEDQFEKRHGTFEDRTKEGIFIRRVTETREVPKYRQWVQNKYILERIIPNNGTELVTKLTYEPVYTFENPFNDIPSYDAVKFVIESVYKKAAEMVGAKYKEPSKEESLELEKKRIDKIVEELYGDRTDISDALAYKEGIVVPSNYGVVK